MILKFWLMTSVFLGTEREKLHAQICEVMQQYAQVLVDAKEIGYKVKGLNKGGFSWRRFIGMSAAQARISRKLGIPISRAGRQRKIGAAVEKLILRILGIKF